MVELRNFCGLGRGCGSERGRVRRLPLDRNRGFRRLHWRCGGRSLRCIEAGAALVTRQAVPVDRVTALPGRAITGQPGRSGLVLSDSGQG